MVSTVTLPELREALATVSRMGGADPAWRRATRIARAYARQEGISLGQALARAAATHYRLTGVELTGNARHGPLA